jgi:transcriptional regulator with PAS, ATPase and Fis domain
MLIKDLMKNLDNCMRAEDNIDANELKRLFALNLENSTVIIEDKDGKFLGLINNQDIPNNLSQKYQATDLIAIPNYVVNEGLPADTLRPLLKQLKNNEYIFVINDNDEACGFFSEKHKWLLDIFESYYVIPAASILNSFSDALIIIDKEGKIIYCNHASNKVLNFPIKKLLGKKLKDVDHKSPGLKTLKDRVPLRGIKTRIHGIDLDVVVDCSPIYNAGVFLGVLSVFKTLPEAMEVSKQVLKAEQLNASFNKAFIPTPFNKIIGTNHNLLRILKVAAKASFTDLPVSITGESGTGKELLARSIHDSSRRSSGPFIGVNCAAIPETLLESELFGYEEGAFTGAKKRGKKGKFQLAHGGTLFLDEIGDMGKHLQAILLRALQEKKIERLGSELSIDLDIRIISSTNQHLKDLIKENLFREDLYYRLNVVPITLPPLRDRMDDLPLLIDHILTTIIKDKKLSISNDAMELLFSYQWPGNIRELTNLLEYASLLCSGGIIMPQDLPKYLFSNTTEETILLDSTLDLKTAQFKTEEKMFQEALKTSKTKTEAMKKLGISRRSFYEKIKKYGLDEIQF